MPTPALYQDPGGTEPFSTTPAERQTPNVGLLYITDRGPESDPEQKGPYGVSRSRSLAYGEAVVKLVPNLDWTSLEQQSRLAERTIDVNLELGTVEELGRFPEVPYDLEVRDAGLMTARTALEEHQAIRERFQADIQRRLRHSPSKTVMLYIHGFNETFSSAGFTAAELCHFFGREHVCAFFT